MEMKLYGVAYKLSDQPATGCEGCVAMRTPQTDAREVGKLRKLCRCFGMTCLETGHVWEVKDANP